jgi:Tfp pilus assembly PilM family ATPase/Tfp pilus assembly protein PilN
MARPSEITSTQRLLRVIRKKKTDEPAASGLEESPVKKHGRFKLSPPALSALHKSSTVGIDIGADYLRLVRVAERGRGNWQILDRRRLAVPPDTAIDTPEFAAFLKSALGSVCRSPKHSHLWTLMASTKVDVHHVNIPKVADKLLGNMVYWTVKKESPFDDKEMILDFEVQGEVIEQEVAKLAVMAYTAPRQEIEDLKNLFSRIGWPLTGITIAPFSVQNLFRTEWVPVFDITVANLYIDADFSRIDIYAGGNLVMTRGIKAGLNSMIDALVERVGETKTDPDAPPLTSGQGREIMRCLGDAPLSPDADVGYGLTKDAVFKMIEPALERLVRQVERTFEYFHTTKPDSRIERIFVSDAMNISPSVVDFIGTHLGTASAILDPLVDEESTTSPDVDDLHRVSERIAFGQALGLALSDNERTPNQMLTYKNKERETSIKRINRVVFAIFIVAVLVCAAIFTYQNHLIGKKRDMIAGLKEQLAQAGPAVDHNQILALVAKLKQKNELSKVYADRYLGLVLIGELAAQTPAHIRFTDLKISLGPATRGEPGKKEPPKARVEEITVEGLILGERAAFETSLAAFTMALEASPLFKQVTVQKNSVEPYLKGETLHFILNMKVEEQVHG